MSIILKQETAGSIATPSAGKATLYVDSVTSALTLKQANGTTSNIPGISTSNTQVMFNDANTIGGSSNFVFAKNTNTLTVANVNVGSYIVINGDTTNVSGIGRLEAFYVDATSGMGTTSITVSATANLGAVGNVIITGGSSGYVLSTNGSGNLSWVAQSGGSANLEAVNSDILPTFDAVYDLGSTAKRFDKLYLGTSANINGAVLTGSTVGNTITLTANDAFSANALLSTSALIGNVSIIANTISAVDYYGNVNTLSVTGNLALGAVGNLKIPGGSSGQVISTDGAGNLSWSSSIAQTVQSISGAYNIQSSDRGKLLLMSTGTDTAYFPSLSAISAGWSVQIYGSTGGFVDLTGVTLYESGTNGGTSQTGGFWSIGGYTIVTLTYVGGTTFIANKS